MARIIPTEVIMWQVFARGEVIFVWIVGEEVEEGRKAYSIPKMDWRMAEGDSIH